MLNFEENWPIFSNRVQILSTKIIPGDEVGTWLREHDTNEPFSRYLIFDARQVLTCVKLDSNWGFNCISPPFAFLVIEVEPIVEDSRRLNICDYTGGL